MTQDAALALVCRDVKKSFGSTHALAGVSLQVRQGEMVALLGPNGAGKVHLVPDPHRAVRGRFGAGRGAGCGHASRPGVGTGPPGRGVPADGAGPESFRTCQPALSRRSCTVCRGANRQVASRSCWRIFRLQRWPTCPARSLSGGNRRKVELAASAVARAAACYLMDEATVGLDPASRSQLIDEVVLPHPDAWPGRAVGHAPGG